MGRSHIGMPFLFIDIPVLFRVVVPWLPCLLSPQPEVRRSCYVCPVSLNLPIASLFLAMAGPQSKKWVCLIPGRIPALLVHFPQAAWPPYPRVVFGSFLRHGLLRVLPLRQVHQKPAAGNRSTQL